MCVSTDFYNYPYDIEIDNDNNAIVAGYSLASTFPVTQGAFNVIQNYYFDYSTINYRISWIYRSTDHKAGLIPLITKWTFRALNSH